MTQLKEPNENNWGKLKWMMKYLKEKIHLKLKLSSDGMCINKWYVVASFVVHADCKGLTGAMIMLRKDTVLTLSWKQEVNGWSSMEMGLISDDIMPEMLWMRYMVNASYNIERNMMFRDNTRCMSLMNKW